MPFVAVPGLKGKVYVPDGCRSGTGKYPCRDCYSCQHCSDDRCRVCRVAGKCAHNKRKTKFSLLNVRDSYCSGVLE